MLGMLGLCFELSNPGVILPGVIGGISLILAFFAMQSLPINYAGLLLILFGIVLLIAEIKVVSHGVLAVGGIVALARRHRARPPPDRRLPERGDPHPLEARRRLAGTGRPRRKGSG